MIDAPHCRLCAAAPIHARRAEDEGRTKDALDQSAAARHPHTLSLRTPRFSTLTRSETITDTPTYLVNRRRSLPPTRSLARSMAAPAFSASSAVDREGLTPAEFAALNEHWEDDAGRCACFRQLVLSPLSAAIDLPSVLYPLVLAYLSPPSLPPDLQARRAAKQQMDAELRALLDEQTALSAELHRVAHAADTHLAFRLQARAMLQQRARQAEQLQQQQQQQTEAEQSQESRNA